MQVYTLPPTQFYSVAPGVELAYARVTPPPATTTPKTPILLIIGWTCVKEDWHGLPFALVEGGHEVLVYDHRGIGESSKVTERYSMDRLADDAADLARHVFGNRAPIHVMGISMGGMCAQVLAARHPSLLRTLILGCTTLSVARPVDGPPVNLSLLNMSVDPPKNLAEARDLVAKLLAANYTPDWISADPARFEQLVDYNLRWRRPLLAGDLQNRAIGRFDGVSTVDRLVASRLPVLLLHGTSDNIIPVTQARVLARHMPHAKLVLLEQVGHLFWIQAPTDTSRALRDFLDLHDRGGDDIKAKL